MSHARAPEGHAREEASPDSGNLRVSNKTEHESGIPPARDRLARSADTDAALEQLENVLVQSTRGEANMSLLLRGLQHLTSGANEAREAHALLLRELETLRARVARVYEHEKVLLQRVRSLEGALEAAARERDSWLLQEDAFLVELLDEQEQKLLAAERAHDRRLAELDHALDELQKQRDLARTEVTRLLYERDAAVALLNEPIASTERTPSPPPSSTLRSPLGSVKLPALKSKPVASSRPLVGYSVVHEDVAKEGPGKGRPPKVR
jgi:DNA repair exonuclease SbcCD ATPase subunit